jgi:hypothetical protein
MQGPRGDAKGLAFADVDGCGADRSCEVFTF